MFCPESCDACDMLDPKKRCDRERLGIKTEPHWMPGDLDKTFHRILKQYKEEYNVKVLAQPPDGPWVLSFENVVKDDEITALLKAVEGGYTRSTDQGARNEYGEQEKVVSQGRTSSNAWCGAGCESDPLVRRIYDRLANITDVPFDNYENFQVLEYQKSQYYNVHHDMGAADNEQPSGPRILTFYLYLTDVDDGGETEFPRIGIKMTPKKGSAILWPSVMDDDPTEQDPRTHHAALPVKAGLKRGANVWMHLYNFRIPNLWGCTGAFD